MRIWLILLACVLVVTPRIGAADEPSAMNPNPRGFDPSVGGAAFGHRYSSTLHTNPTRLLAVPRWTDEASEPPVSVREAIVIAGRKVDEFLEVPDGYTRHVNYVWLRHWQNSLFPQGAWYWVVRFEWLGPENERPPHQLSIVVLMDGQALTPRKERPRLDASDRQDGAAPERNADEQ